MKESVFLKLLSRKQKDSAQGKGFPLNRYDREATWPSWHIESAAQSK